MACKWCSASNTFKRLWFHLCKILQKNENERKYAMHNKTIWILTALSFFSPPVVSFFLFLFFFWFHVNLFFYNYTFYFFSIFNKFSRCFPCVTLFIRYICLLIIYIRICIREEEEKRHTELAHGHLLFFWIAADRVFCIVYYCVDSFSIFCQFAEHLCVCVCAHGFRLLCIIIIIIIDIITIIISGRNLIYVYKYAYSTKWVHRFHSSKLVPNLFISWSAMPWTKMLTCENKMESY